MLLPFLSAAYAFTGRTPFWQASGLGLQFPRTLTPRVKDFRLCKEAPQPTQLLIYVWCAGGLSLLCKFPLMHQRTLSPPEKFLSLRLLKLSAHLEKAGLERLILL